MIHCFAPIVRPQTRVLIIGSMPSIKSLDLQQYYAHPRNQFWKLIFDLLENGRKPVDYTDKVNALLNHRIGLWDVFAACHREGSLDSHITRKQPNDFPALFHTYPAIKTLLFSGKTAYTYFLHTFGTLEKNCYSLPSTSPAMAQLSYLEKRAIWKQTFIRAGLLGPNS